MLLLLWMCSAQPASDRGSRWWAFAVVEEEGLEEIEMGREGTRHKVRDMV